MALGPENPGFSTENPRDSHHLSRIAILGLFLERDFPNWDGHWGVPHRTKPYQRSRLEFSSPGNMKSVWEWLNLYRLHQKKMKIQRCWWSCKGTNRSAILWDPQNWRSPSCSTEMFIQPPWLRLADDIQSIPTASRYVPLWHWCSWLVSSCGSTARQGSGNQCMGTKLDHKQSEPCTCANWAWKCDNCDNVQQEWVRLLDSHPKSAQWPKRKSGILKSASMSIFRWR